MHKDRSGGEINIHHLPFRSHHPLDDGRRAVYLAFPGPDAGTGIRDYERIGGIG